MKTKNILGAMAVAFLVLALPNVMTAALCSSYGDFADLQAAGFCTIDGFRFDNFTFSGTSGGGALAPTATNTTFTVLNGFISTSGQPIYGFDFDPNLSVLGNQTQDIKLTFDVTADRLTDIPAISSVHLQLNGSASNGAKAEVDETDTGYNACTGVSPPPCENASGPGTILGPPTPLVVQPGSPTTIHQDYFQGTSAWGQAGPYLFMHVSKDINVTGTIAGSSCISGASCAGISEVLDAFDKSVVPEPASVAYIALGCLALFGAVRRRRKQA